MGNNMPANLENSAIVTGLEKVSFHFNTKECSNYSTIMLISLISKVMPKILQEMGIPDYLTRLLRNLYAGQEAPVRTGHDQQTGSKLGKEYVKAVSLSPCLFNFYAEYIMQNARLDEQAGIQIVGRNINNLR